MPERNNFIKRNPTILIILLSSSYEISAPFWKLANKEYKLYVLKIPNAHELETFETFELHGEIIACKKGIFCEKEPTSRKWYKSEEIIISKKLKFSFSFDIFYYISIIFCFFFFLTSMQHTFYRLPNYIIHSFTFSYIFLLLVVLIQGIQYGFFSFYPNPFFCSEIRLCPGIHISPQFILIDLSVVIIFIITVLLFFL